MARASIIVSLVVILSLAALALPFPPANVATASTGEYLFEQYNRDGCVTASYAYGTNHQLAQTFTAESTHSVTSVRLPLGRNGSCGQVTVAITPTANGQPLCGQDMAWGQIEESSLPLGNPAWMEVIFSPSCVVTEGTRYAIVLRAPSGNSDNCSRWLFCSDLPLYAGGNREDMNNAEYCMWQSYTAWDFLFEVYGYPSEVWVAPPPAGSDNNTGTEAEPFATIQKGIDSVAEDGTVHVAAGTYVEGLHISKSITLDGAGAPGTIIDGGGISENNTVVEFGSDPGEELTISGFTIQNGYQDGVGGIFIQSMHTLNLDDCTVRNNHNGGEGAGGILNNGTLIMNRCTVNGNTTPEGGGGINNRGTLSLTDCTISENSVTESDGQGGGIWNSGTLTINRCCISGNHACRGSGIYTMPAATATLTNCTISGNTGIGAGGGIRNWGIMWCYNVTISENHGSVGGGFSNNNDINSPPAIMHFKNCIVAGNTADDGIHNNGYDDFAGTGIQSQGYNIDSENSCYFNDSTDQRNTPPLLGTLQNNGGPTSTHAITAGSPAFNRGTCDGAPTTDQRGVTRPQGTYCDIGAFELELHQSAQVATATGTGTATFATSNGYITALTADTSTPCGTLSGFSFPHGFFSFTISDIPAGSTVTITITLPSDMPTNTQYWKCINGQWVNVTSVLGDNDGDNILTLTITDGSQFDADGQVNGIIVDPGAPAVPVPGATVPAPAAHRVSPTLPNQFKRAQMSLQYLNVNPQQAAANQPVNITTNVVNTGDEAGNYNITLKINGQVEQTKMVSVGPQATQPVKFTLTRAQPGTYAVNIGGQKGSFTILGAGSGTASTPSSSDLIAILIMGVLIIAVAVLLMLIFRRVTG